ncbi:hypothetical protein L1887_49820 [Cichorium endivia]|nr:hypothetical protein L1887_49820 [Cichorium endivia]
MAYIQTISTSSLQRRRYTRRSFLSVQILSLREAVWNAEGRIIDRLLFAREAIRPALFFSSRDARAHTLLTHPRQTSRKQCSFPSCQPLSCRAQSAERKAQSAKRTDTELRASHPARTQSSDGVLRVAQSFCAAWAVHPQIKPCLLSALAECTHSIPCRVVGLVQRSPRPVPTRAHGPFVQVRVRRFRLLSRPAPYIGAWYHVGDTARDHNESHASASASKREGAFGQVYEATSAGSKTVSPHHRRCSMLQGRLLHATLPQLSARAGSAPAYQVQRSSLQLHRAASL